MLTVSADHGRPLWALCAVFLNVGASLRISSAHCWLNAFGILPLPNWSATLAKSDSCFEMRRIKKPMLIRTINHSAPVANRIRGVSVSIDEWGIIALNQRRPLSYIEITSLSSMVAQLCCLVSVRWWPSALHSKLAWSPKLVVLWVCLANRTDCFWGCRAEREYNFL